MESKIPEWFLSFHESLFLAQLRSVRQLKSPKPKKAKRREGKSMSNMDMAIDILILMCYPSFNLTQGGWHGIQNPRMVLVFL